MAAPSPTPTAATATKRQSGNSDSEEDRSAAPAASRAASTPAHEAGTGISISSIANSGVGLVLSQFKKPSDRLGDGLASKMKEVFSKQLGKAINVMNKKEDGEATDGGSAMKNVSGRLRFDSPVK